MSRRYRVGSTDMSTGFALFTIACWVIICALCWPYIINTWLIYFGKPPAIVWWQGAIIGFIPYMGRLTIAGTAITWVLINWIL